MGTSSPRLPPNSPCRGVPSPGARPPPGPDSGEGEAGTATEAVSPTRQRAGVPARGGLPTHVTEFGEGEVTHRWPQILPGGKAVLFAAHTFVAGFDDATIEVMSLADHRRKTLVR